MGKIGASGKYFEGQFVSSFHQLFIGDKRYYIIRLKDPENRVHNKKQQDVGDYLVFWDKYVFNVELKARENGIIYSSGIDSRQVDKWISFEYNSIRVPIMILKDTVTKRIGIFFRQDYLSSFLGGKTTLENARFTYDYNDSQIPYDLKSVFEKIVEYVENTKS